MEGLINISDEQKEKLAYILAVARCIRNIFSLEIRIKKQMLSLRNEKWKDFYNFSSRPLFRELKEFSDKNIPVFVKNSNKNVKAAFIKGFFDAEGNVDIHIIKSRNEMQRHIRCFSNDLNLLKEICILLKDFEIKSFIGKNKNRTYCLTAWGYNSLVSFQKNIGFVIKRKSELLRKAVSSYKQIQVRWDADAYDAVMRIRKGENIGAEKIKKKLSDMGFSIPKPTIEAWIYKKCRGDSVMASQNGYKRDADDNTIFIGKNRG